MEQATTEKPAVRLDSDLTLDSRSARVESRIKSLSRGTLGRLHPSSSRVQIERSDYGLTARVEDGRRVDGWTWVMSWQLAERTGQITLIRLPTVDSD